MLCFLVICHFSVCNGFRRNAGSLACDQTNHRTSSLHCLAPDFSSETEVYKRRPLRRRIGGNGALIFRKRQMDDECRGGKLVTER